MIEGPSSRDHGGSVANNDPAADYPAGVLGLNATVNTNKRSIPADEFFVDMFETALEEGELLMGFSIPGAKCELLKVR